MRLQLYRQIRRKCGRWRRFTRDWFFVACNSILTLTWIDQEAVDDTVGWVRFVDQDDIKLARSASYHECLNLPYSPVEHPLSGNLRDLYSIRYGQQ